ncbi:flagellar hook-associated protein FlgK [Bacillus cereus group sp. TH152-1LC]|uniref:flagellar hook-associated protein FlgK n=1 Tax=Bacillus cereus group sp. TH152-1LC TaxID=3018060 RepID=UPI0022E1337D|nr:flagellar hook-associated protein FlgK [Bacillus cereus group sp. TH152-1LC]MDA1674894.1 flagellar hook-associated protein FlgK [Bacillus cereus group sp. TH152-1LC]
MTLGFNTSLSGLFAAQRGIQTSQMNVSNLNTEGYVRQRMQLSENASAGGAGIEQKIGSGVLVESIKRMTDANMRNNYNNQSSRVGYYEQIESVLNEVETVMGDYSIGKLSNMMGGFFNAWQEVSKFPEESSYRYALVGETAKFTQKINEMGKELSRVEQDTVGNIGVQVSEMNTILNGLAEVNKKINQTGEFVPNALLNERDRLVNKLSSYAEIEVSFESNNPEAISIRSGGAYLLDNEKSYDIRLVNSNNEYYLSNGTARIDMSTGKLKANLDIVDNYIGSYKKQLDTFATGLIKQVNDIHKTGFSINGDTGIDFFVGTGSKDIAINPALKADPSKLATSAVAGVEGNTDIAKQIGNVMNQTVSDNMSFRNYVNSFSMEMAQDLNTVSNQVAIQNEVLTGIGERKASIEGVNLEEEMTNLMMYQKLFTANAKAIKAIDETLDTILNIKQ